MLNHAHRVVSMLLAAKDCTLPISAFMENKEFPKSGGGQGCYRLGTYLWEVETKLGKKVERIREGRKITALKLVPSEQELAEAKKKAAAEKRAATMAAKGPKVKAPKMTKAEKKAAKAASEMGPEQQPAMETTSEQAAA